MPLERLATAATLVAQDDAGVLRFVGSCFAFRSKYFFLTAAHCVRGLSADRLTIRSAFASPGLPVARVVTHPHADLAALIVEKRTPHGITFLPELASSTDTGTEVSALEVVSKLP